MQPVDPALEGDPGLDWDDEYEDEEEPGGEHPARPRPRAAAVAALVGVLAAALVVNVIVDWGDGGASSEAAGAGPAPAARALDCGRPAAAGQEISPALQTIRDATVLRSGVPVAAPYEGFTIRCDNVASSSVEVPTAWTDTRPLPGAVPQSVLTVGPDLSSRVEAQPVVGVGVDRYVGEPLEPAAVNESNADSSLENGTRELPRRGETILAGCTALSSEPYASNGFHGEVQAYVDCDGDVRAWLLAAAHPDDGTRYRIRLVGQFFDTADLDVMIRALASMSVDPRRVPGMQLPPLPPATDASATTTTAPASGEDAP